jgi:hypothetical protein
MKQQVKKTSEFSAKATRKMALLSKNLMLNLARREKHKQ